MSHSSTGSHMKHKQQMCERNGTFDACKRGHKTTHVAAFDPTTSPMEVPPEMFWTWAPPDSLGGSPGPITKDDLEHDSLSVQFSNLMWAPGLSFPLFLLLTMVALADKSEKVGVPLFSYTSLCHVSVAAGVPFKIDLYEHLPWKFHL